MGGAIGRGDPLAQDVRRFARFGQHARRADEGLYRQCPGRLGGQALFFSGCLHGLA